jgi:hypothetical protein
MIVVARYLVKQAPPTCLLANSLHKLAEPMISSKSVGRPPSLTSAVGETNEVIPIIMGLALYGESSLLTTVRRATVSL